MAVIEVPEVDSVRAIKIPFRVGVGQGNVVQVTFAKQPNEEFPITLDVGYTMEIKGHDGNVEKTLTVGSGITLDITDLDNPKMTFDFGNDLLQTEYSYKMKAANFVPPFDILFFGTIKGYDPC